MTSSGDPSLSAWESFYVIVGSSGAALIGIQFVVITLVAWMRRRPEPVVAYDRLGFGRRAHPGALALSFILDEAGNVASLSEQLGLDATVPFGHSVGGAMAVATAARFCDRCVAVVTLSAQAFVEDRTVCSLRDAQAAFERPGQLARLERYHGPKARWVLESWLQTWCARPSPAGASTRT